MLDTAASQLEIERLDGAITLKKNAQHQVQLELERRTLMDLQAQVDAKRLDLQSLGAKTAQNRKLGAAGLLSADAVHDSELTEAKSRIELEALESAMRNSKVTSKAKLAGLDLEMLTLVGERDEARRQLELATMTSDRDGVLTWVVAEEGATLTRGAIVARIADLGSFRVDATISDVHAQQLSVGLPVRVKIGDDLLPGAVSNVLPAIQNGTITLSVRLDDPSNSLLRSNLRVDVLRSHRSARKCVANSEGGLCDRKRIRRSLRDFRQPRRPANGTARHVRRRFVRGDRWHGRGRRSDRLGHSRHRALQVRHDSVSKETR
ncbi:MAG: efflux RND transporter periplasmic adaptor subunit [Blastocatellia bacterium]|nr:efflux RND transporter periplasmic adaptor subunit [Blastocatellia bacterium]